MPKIVIVRPLLSKGFPRFVIASLDGELWSGDRWKNNVVAARLFNDLSEATVEANRLQLEEFPDAKALHYFVVPFNVTLRTEVGTPVHQDEVASWLLERVCLRIDVGDGTGPYKGSVVAAHLDYNEIAPI